MIRLWLARTRGQRNEVGAAAVEFALVFPLLLFLIFLLLDLSRLLLLSSTLHGAAAEGVRVAAKSVSRNISSVSTTTTSTMPDAVTRLADSSCSDSESCLAVSMSNTCATNGLVTVSAKQTFRFLAPDAVIFSFFIRGSGNAGFADISATATAVCLD